MDDVEPLMLDTRGVEALGKVDDEEKSRRLAAADVLCAPSLGGESFGMVLTEAFAHATPVVASNIAGYKDVVRDGVDGVLVPPGDGTAVAGALRDLALDPERRRSMGAAAREHAHRYAWSHVADEVIGAYEDAIAMPEPETRFARAATKIGAKPTDGEPWVAPRRIPSLEPAPARRARPAFVFAKRAVLVLAAVLALGGAWLALQRIGTEAIFESLVNSSPTWTLIGLGIMCSSMILRAQAWYAILRAALPRVRIKRSDALQGTTIGVLMSATLPARLGEPARALIVARRLGSPRERLPVVLGTMVSQTLLNIVALIILGVTMLSTVDLFTNNQALFGVAIAPIVVLLCVLVAPALLRAGGAAAARNMLSQVRQGLEVFRRPKLGLTATAAQLGAWGLQWAVVLRAARRLRARRPGGDRRRRRGALRGQRHRRPARRAVEPRRLPGGLRGRARRLRRGQRGRAGLRHRPPGGGDRHRRADGRARARARGPLLARRPHAGDARGSGDAAGSRRTEPVTMTTARATG